MNLTKKQKQLLCDLIDGYFYPRYLRQSYDDPKWDRTTEFKEIRKVLDPNGSTELFQYDYFEHPTFRSKEWLAKYQYETEDLMTEKEWLKKHQLNKEKN